MSWEDDKMGIIFSATAGGVAGCIAGVASKMSSAGVVTLGMLGIFVGGGIRWGTHAKPAFAKGPPLPGALPSTSAPGFKTGDRVRLVDAFTDTSEAVSGGKRQLVKGKSYLAGTTFTVLNWNPGARSAAVLDAQGTTPIIPIALLELA